MDSEAPKPPKGAVILALDANAKTDGPLHMWTWEGATQWYYVLKHPIPEGHAIHASLSSVQATRRGRKR